MWHVARLVMPDCRTASLTASDGPRAHSEAADHAIVAVDAEWSGRENECHAHSVAAGDT